MLTSNYPPLDLRGTKCPLNFVKTKLALEKCQPQEVLEVWILQAGESAINIPQSIQQEGHLVLKQEATAEGILKLWVQKQGG